MVGSRTVGTKKEKKKVEEKTKEKGKGKVVKQVRSERGDTEDGELEWVDEILERIWRMERSLWAKVHVEFKRNHAKLKNIVDLIDPEWSDYSVEDKYAGLELEIGEWDGEEEEKGLREEREFRGDHERWSAWLNGYQESKEREEEDEEVLDAENGVVGETELAKKGEEEKNEDEGMEEVESEREEEGTGRVEVNAEVEDTEMGAEVNAADDSRNVEEIPMDVVK